MPGKVFISHSTIDSELAENVRKFLESRDIPCWICSRDIRVGGLWEKDIVNAIRNCQHFVLLLTRNADSSAEVAKEVLLADKQHKHVLPIVFDDGVPTNELEYQIANRQCLDARNTSLEDWGSQVVVAIKDGIQAAVGLVDSKIAQIDSEPGAEEVLSTIHWELALLEHASAYSVESHVGNILEAACRYSQRCFEREDWGACLRIHDEVSSGLRSFLNRQKDDIVFVDFDVEILLRALNSIEMQFGGSTDLELRARTIQSAFTSLLDRSQSETFSPQLNPWTYAFVVCLFIISTISLFLAYYPPNSTLTWELRFDSPFGMKGQGPYLEASRSVGLAALLIYLFLTQFRTEYFRLLIEWRKISWKRPWITPCRIFLFLFFAFALWTTLNHAMVNAPAQQTRWAASQLAAFNASEWEAYKEWWPDLHQQLKIESEEGFKGNLIPYTYYLPYCLINYTIYGVGLFSVVIYSVLTDGRRLFNAKKALLNALDSRAVHVSKIDSDFILFFETCFRHTRRYTTLLVVIACMIVYESTVTRKTLSESGWQFEIMASVAILFAASIWVIILVHFYEGAFQKCRQAKRRKNVESEKWEERWNTTSFLSKCFLNAKGLIAVLLNLLPFLIFFLWN